MGLHGEVMINYCKLDRMAEGLGSYLASVDRVQGTIDENSRLLSDQRGAVFEMLEGRRGLLKKLLGEQQEKAQNLLESVKRYNEDMERLIHPVTRWENVRVRGYDIGYNLKQIRSKVGDIFAPKIRINNETNPYMDVWESTDDMGGGYFKPNQAKIDKEVRNGKTVDEFQDVYLSGVKMRVNNGLDELMRIYKDNVQAFKEMDDYHASLANEVYKQYTGALDRVKDFDRNVKVGIFDFGRGVWGAGKEIALGIAEFVKAGAGYVVTEAAYFFGAQPPDWALNSDEVLLGFKELKDGRDFFEKMAQGICDGYENEGLAYVIGSTAVDAGTFVVPYVGVAGKAGSISAKIGSVVKKSSGLANATVKFSGVSSKFGKVVDVAGKVSRMGGAAGFGGKSLRTSGNIGQAVKLMGAVNSAMKYGNVKNVSGLAGLALKAGKAMSGGAGATSSFRKMDELQRLINMIIRSFK